jgi:hypothetical protein
MGSVRISQSKPEHCSRSSVPWSVDSLALDALWARMFGHGTHTMANGGGEASLNSPPAQNKTNGWPMYVAMYFGKKPKTTTGQQQGSKAKENDDNTKVVNQSVNLCFWWAAALLLRHTQTRHRLAFGPDSRQADDDDTTCMHACMRVDIGQQQHPHP